MFGELLYSLERRGNERAVELSVSRDRFWVPKNLVVIGTMNAADQSIALIDVALRRRFHFVELEPDTSILRAWLAEQAPDMASAAEVLDALNAELKREGLDANLAIGHSHFMVPGLDENALDACGPTASCPRSRTTSTASRRRSPDSATKPSSSNGSSRPLRPTKTHSTSTTTMRRRTAMAERIVLREHQPLELTLAATTTAFLRDHFPRALDVVPGWGTGVTLKAESHIGTIVTPEVEMIRPKCGTTNVFAMLSHAYRLARLRSDLVHQDRIDDVRDFLIAILAGHLEDLVQRGLRRGYVERDDDLPVLRGRLSCRPRASVDGLADDSALPIRGLHR